MTNGRKNDRPKSFEEAYRRLDEALVQTQSPDLKPLISQETTVLKTQFVNETTRLKNEVTTSVHDLSVLGREHIVELAGLIEKDIRKNPALYLGGIALGALALGLLASAPKKGRRA